MPAPLHIASFGTGPGTGPAVVLLHSSGLSGRQWSRLAGELAKRGRRAVVPDLTGHGASPPWPEPTPFSFRTDVDAVAALLREVGPADVVGHSYGGFVALQAARVVPESVVSLALFEPVAFGCLDPAKDGQERIELARVETPWGASKAEHEQWLQAFVEYWGGAGAWTALRDDARDEFRRVGWVVYEGVRTLRGDATPAAAYAALGKPMHLWTAEHSPAAAHRVVQRLGDAVRGATVHRVPNAGHMAPLAQAGLVNAMICEALGV